MPLPSMLFEPFSNPVPCHTHVLQDATGMIRGAVDRAVLTDGRGVKTGAALLLQQVGVTEGKGGFTHAKLPHNSRTLFC